MKGFSDEKLTKIRNSSIFDKLVHQCSFSQTYEISYLIVSYNRSFVLEESRQALSQSAHSLFRPHLGAKPFNLQTVALQKYRVRPICVVRVSICTHKLPRRYTNCPVWLGSEFSSSASLSRSIRGIEFDLGSTGELFFLSAPIHFSVAILSYCFRRQGWPFSISANSQ